MSEDVKPISDSEKKKEDWMNAKWRPMMGWVYMATCTADFVIFPILWSMLQSISHGQVTSQWQPLTLQGAGLYHIAMGAVLGLAAFGRTQEKLAGANNGGLSIPTNLPSGQPSTFGVPQTAPSNFSTPTSGGFGASSSFGGSSFGGTSPAVPAGRVEPSLSNEWVPQVVTGFGGKPAPVQPPQPAI